MTDIKQGIIELLLSTEQGLTWKELQVGLNKQYGIKAHHGTISGTLNNLHSERVAFSLKSKRENCKPYCHTSFRKKHPASERNDRPSVTKWKGMAEELYSVMSTEQPFSPRWVAALERCEKMIYG